MAATINRLLLAAVGPVAYVDVSLGLTVGPRDHQQLQSSRGSLQGMETAFQRMRWVTSMDIPWSSLRAEQPSTQTVTSMSPHMSCLPCSGEVVMSVIVARDAVQISQASRQQQDYPPILLCCHESRSNMKLFLNCMRSFRG